ncbi:MAG: hypothetical protein PHE49_06840 [bacterium]|nr:hypothetical protein [bacterium]
MNTTQLDALFTPESLLGLQGAVAASLLVPNTVCYLFGQKADKHRKWLSLIVALGLAFMTASIAPTQSGMKWLLAFFNGLLIFSSAAGMNQISAAGKGQNEGETDKEVIPSENVPNKSLRRTAKTELPEGAKALNVRIKTVPSRKFFTNWF